MAMGEESGDDGSRATGEGGHAPGDSDADGEGGHAPGDGHADGEGGHAPGDGHSAGEHADEGGHHLPAVRDFPRGFGEASWWPFVAAVGATGVYVGAGLFVLGRGDGAMVGPAVGSVAFAASMVVFLVGLAGWTYQAFVAEYWPRGPGDASKLRWGMVLFLGTELATFGAGFVYYFFVRVGAWPPAGAELPNLRSSLILANTLVLVTSSVTLHRADGKLKRGNHASFVRWLGVTLLLGLAFLAGQVVEYHEFIVGEGFTLTSGVFASAFFGLTGLHGLHVTLGAILLAVLLARALAGQYDADRHSSVTTVSYYWHFVDAVWLFLVATIYLWASA